MSEYNLLAWCDEYTVLVVFWVNPANLFPDFCNVCRVNLNLTQTRKQISCQFVLVGVYEHVRKRGDVLLPVTSPRSLGFSSIKQSPPNRCHTNHVG